MSPLADRLAGIFGDRPESVAPVGGGDIGDAWRVRAAGQDWFAKIYGVEAGPQMVAAEARGLGWLAEAGALRIPEVRACDADLLVLQWIEPGSANAATDEALGRGLAALHRFGAPGFGLDHDNFIGRLPQRNDLAPSWPEFYAERRVAPLLASAGLEGLGAPLLERLPELVGPDEPPARLHGDLWGGNWMCDSSGAPVIFDPAVVGGHREVDLAMAKLFGGFSSRFFDAYGEAYPLAPGAEDRVVLYQLYPLLVHLLLFGGGYRDSVERAIRTYV